MKCEFCRGVLHEGKYRWLHENNRESCIQKKDFLLELESEIIKKSPANKIWISGGGRIILMLRGKKPDKNWYKRALDDCDHTARKIYLFEKKNNIWFFEMENDKTGMIKNPFKAKKHLEK